MRILPDGTVKLVVHKHDSGTGTHTALAACVAEELDVNPMTVQVISPEDPFFETYIHPIWKVFSTGGSTSVSLEYDRLRMAGATARALLITAAAKQWKVSPDSCITEEGRVVHGASKRSLGYGELVGVAAHLPAPAKVTLKDPAQFRYIGKLRHKRDAQAKVCGRFKYSIDVVLPDMLVAVIQRAPVLGATVVSMDSAAALQVPGVRKVIKVPGRPDVLGGNVEGVAVLADSYWAAHQGRELLKVQWSDSPLAGFDSDELAKAQVAALADQGAQRVSAMAAGDVNAQWPNAAKLLEADYRMPYKVQNPLEPICITAQVKDNAITYWGGVQVPSSALEAAQVICKFTKDKVTINERVSGGSFRSAGGQVLVVRSGLPGAASQGAGETDEQPRRRNAFIVHAPGHAAPGQRCAGCAGSLDRAAARRGVAGLAGAVGAGLFRAPRQNGLQHHRSHHRLGFRLSPGQPRPDVGQAREPGAQWLVSLGELHPQCVRRGKLHG